jgi:hypothetical protein
MYLDELYDVVVRQIQSQEFWQRAQIFATEPAPKKGESDKVVRLKAQLLRARLDMLFVRVAKDTPCDNN